MNNAVKEALKKVLVEERRLSTELAKLRGVRRVLEAELGIGPAAEKRSRKTAAPHWALEEAILKTLPRGRKLSRGQIIEAIGKTDYAHSLEPQHVTKTLLRMREDKKLVREGEDRFTKWSRR